jgi:hypothetical protein
MPEGLMDKLYVESCMGFKHSGEEVYDRTIHTYGESSEQQS